VASSGSEAIVGKTLGRDLEEGKLTLPFIHHLAGADPADRARLIDLLPGPDQPEHAGGNGNGLDPDRAAAICRLLEASGSVAYARQWAGELTRRAQQSIAGLSDRPAAALMIQTAEAVLTRNE
jgi:octaprenyl-diphosphate synthase